MSVIYTKEDLKKLLVQSSETNRMKYLPWWKDDFTNCIYRYNIFTPEEIQAIHTCISSCPKTFLSEYTGSLGLTVFELLVWLNFEEIVEQALKEENGIDINGTDGRENKITPLMLACCRGNLSMVKLLLCHGANDSCCDAEGRNAYHYLARSHIKGMFVGYECVSQSIAQRAPIAHLLQCNINQKNNGGKTAFSQMLSEGNTNISWALTDVFLEKGVSADDTDENGNTLLMLAISNRHLTAALRLMKNSSLVNRENREGKTPLELASDYRNEGLCIALKDHGASSQYDINRMDISNFSRITSNVYAGVSTEDRDPMTLALYLTKKLLKQADTDDDGDMGCVASILRNALLYDEACQVLDLCKSAGIDFTAPIHSGGTVFCLRDKCFSQNCGEKVLRKFLEFGMNLNKAVIAGRTPANLVASLKKRTMLFQGEKDDYYEQAALYFSRESMEQTDNYGISALHLAAENNHTEMLKVMLEKGADVNISQDAPSEAGNTPLHTACIYGNAEVVKILEDFGADDTIGNINGETPAHHAVMKKKMGGDLSAKERRAVLQELKHLDIARSDGKTPLMLLQYLDINTNIELLPLFLEKGADVNHTDHNGNTALILNAANQCYQGVIKELISAGADVNAIDGEGNSALFYALKYGDKASARYLIKKGADYNKTNRQGISPVQIAVEKGYDTVLELMSDIG